MFHQFENKTVKARKAHKCEGIFEIREWGDTEKEFNEKHECCGINKGDEYHYQVNIYDGVFYKWKSCLACFHFIEKHKLWNTDY